MTGTVITKRVLITVRTYPVPALSGIEVSCTAGITSEGEWIRLFPIPYRFLGDDQRFTKYQWIDVDVTKATSDTRPESYHVNPDSIRIVDPKPLASWLTKRQHLAPLQAPSMEYLIKGTRRAQAPDTRHFQTQGNSETRNPAGEGTRLDRKPNSQSSGNSLCSVCYRAANW